MGCVEVVIRADGLVITCGGDADRSATLVLSSRVGSSERIRR